MIKDVMTEIFKLRRKYIEQKQPIPDICVSMAPDCYDQCRADDPAGMHLVTPTRRIGGYGYRINPDLDKPFLVRECLRTDYE